MAFIVIPSTDVDQGSVVDESLMRDKIKWDLDDLNARLVTLEALSGGGGVAATNAEDLFAEIVAGAEDNVAKFWKVRHHIMMNTTGLGTNSEGLDFEEKELHERFFHDPNFTIVSSMNLNAASYMTNLYFVEQNEQVQFRIKKGENFFCIGTYLAVGAATQFSVFVDGVNANTVGLVDENDVVVTATLSANNATTFYGKLFHFYGLDGEEHVITIKNVNGTALEIPLNYVDVGYRSGNDYAIDHTVKIRAGAANVGGIAATFNEQSFTFAQPGIGLANGHTPMVKISQGGILTAIDGLSPASTQCKPQVAIPFSSGPVTSLSVKNHWYLPDNGICMFTHPSGENYFFSYSSKAQPGGPASQTLDGIIWQAQPREDFTPLPDVAALTVNTFRGDARIEYWAKPPIQISGANNKIDFSITVDGVNTNHSATIPAGFYAADIIRIGKAVVDALKVAKPLPAGHEYYLEYNSLSQLWTIGVRGERVSLISFLWSTGANSASSFGPVIGFSTDSTGQLSYLSPSIKQHLARRVFAADPNVRSSEHPSIKYSWALTTNVTIAEADAIIESHNLGSYRRQDASANHVMFHIYPDEDCCGISPMFMREDVATYVRYSIDGGDEVMLGTNARPNDASSPTKGTLNHSFISFPKGTKRITFFVEANLWFEIESVTQFVTFFGYRQWFTKPQWEMLAPTEKILKTYEVQPLRLFCTAYGHNTALYATQPTNDNLNALTESGVWVQTTGTSLWNARYRSTVTAGGYIDITFVLSGDGGGIGVRRFHGTATTRRMEFFLSTGAIVEATDRVEYESKDQNGTQYKWDFQHLGLPAGTYTLRMKQLDTQTMINNGIIVYDTVLPQTVNGIPGPRTLTDVANTGQSVSWPLHSRKRENSRYQSYHQPSYYAEGAYKRGIVHHGDALSNVINIFNRDEIIDVIEEADVWWASQIFTNTGEYTGYRTFCRSLSAMLWQFSTYSTVIQPNLDGRNLNTISSQNQVKGGFAPSATRNDSAVQCFNNFESSITFDTGLTYLMTDTRGLRVGQKVALTDGTTKEDAFIASIVTDVSFTITKALSVLVDSAVNRVYFWGFHNLRLTAGDALDWGVNGFMYEPLPLEESVIGTRLQSEKREEFLIQRSVLAGVALNASAVVYQSFNYPIHSDGESATRQTADIVLVTSPQNTNVNERLEKGLSAFTSGVVNQAISAKTIDIQSRKFVPTKSNIILRG